MNVHACNAASVATDHLQAGQSKSRPDKPAQPMPKLSPTPTESQDTFEQTEQTPGVIRLLEAGHFRGVADIRLRINFHEELSARQEQAVRSSAGPAASALVEEMQSAVGQWADSAGLTAEQSPVIQAAVETFAQAVQTSAEAVAAGEGSPSNLAGTIGEAFEQLAGAITAAMTPPQDELSPDEILPEPESELLPPEVDLGALRDVFVSALSRLEASMSAGSSLPELSLPSGQGKAYEKFLQIYQAMQSPPQAAVEELPSDPPTDVQA